jgi:hypothetical protein
MAASFKEGQPRPSRTILVIQPTAIGLIKRFDDRHGIFPITFLKIDLANDIGIIAAVIPKMR